MLSIAVEQARLYNDRRGSGGGRQYRFLRADNSFYAVITANNTLYRAIILCIDYYYHWLLIIVELTIIYIIKY